MSAAPDASVTTRDLTYPTGGATQPVRVYKPAGATGPNLPVIVYYHGGAWVIADLDVYDATPPRHGQGPERDRRLGRVPQGTGAQVPGRPRGREQRLAVGASERGPLGAATR